MIRASTVHQLLIGLELVAAGAETAGVGALVHVAVGLCAPDHLGGCHRVVGVGGADESVGGEAEAVEGRLPRRGPGVDQLVRIDPLLPAVALDVGRVLVEAGQEARLAAEKTVVSRDDIRADGLEQRMQRRALARVEDGRGEVVRVALAHRCSRPFGQYSSLRTCSDGKPWFAATSSTALTISGLPHR